MTDSKFTPGPWIIERGDSTANFIYDNQAEDGYLGAIATVEHGDPDELEANTRLIARAPDLANALQWALDLIEDDLDPAHQQALAHARAVLAQATGAA